MNTVQVAQYVGEHGVCLIRKKLGGATGYDIKEHGSGGHKRGWIILDSFSASAITAVYNALQKPELKEKLEKMPIHSALTVCFKLVGKYSRP